MDEKFRNPRLNPNCITIDINKENSQEHDVNNFLDLKYEINFI